ncbi:MAG: ribonuclease HI family protein [Candidatus Omnitrophota bacterium]|nr:ribonuclease HI family protein [Candidatus Omnitrophota bacterium]
MIRLELYIDGASKGNPGPAGVGVIISRGGEVLKNISAYIGTATNNTAEYTALIYGLREAMALKGSSLSINTDSELLYRQLRKEYRVKCGHLLGLYNQAVRLLGAFPEVYIRHIPREENRGADRLATKAVKEALLKHQ